MAPDNLSEAELLKEKANKFLKDGDYDSAIGMYTKALELNESAIYYSNRSLAYLRTECFGYALADATKAISIDSTYVKGYYRRAMVYMALSKYEDALSDIKIVLRHAPRDKITLDKEKECKKICTLRRFAEAISVEEKASALDLFDPTNVVVDSDYVGPHMEQDTSQNYIVTESFMLELMAHYKSEKKLHRKYAMIILKEIYKLLKSLPSLVDITVPENTKFTVCGDIHGQFYDLMNIFDLNGLPSVENPYLFNGDFVDRGSFSVECIFTLFGYKLLYPNHFYLSRGNHESENMNRFYGFAGEVKSKYSSEMADIFTSIFNWLPLAHLINERILVMHGGLFSTDGITLDDIRKISRDKQPLEGSPMCELLWSDPVDVNGRSVSKRGIGCQFGPDVTEQFCKANGLDYIIRSHEVKAMGYEVAHNGRCITIFSAPNYCDTMHNRGAFIVLTGKPRSVPMKPEFTSFEEVPHPDVRPMSYVNPFLSFFM